MLRLTEKHVAAPAAEARLEDEGRSEAQRRGLAGKMHGLRVRQPGRHEAGGSEQLVVRRNDRLPTVQDAHAPPRDVVDLVEAILDPVESRQDVQPDQSRVTRPKQHRCLVRRDEYSGKAVRLPGGDEIEIRLLT